MCHYEVPVIQWILCGHMQAMPAMRRWCHCNVNTGSSSVATYPSPCAPFTSQYCGRPVLAQGLCHGCLWADYHFRLECVARYGPAVSEIPTRPAFLTPWYARHGDRWYVIGMVPTPTTVDPQDHIQRVMQWVQDQRGYKFRSIADLRSRLGASIEFPPVGYKVPTRSASQYD